MSTYSTIRAAANAERRTASISQSDRPQKSATNPSDAQKGTAQSRYGINSSDRRQDKKTPFKSLETLERRSVRERDSGRFTPREDVLRTGSAGKRIASDTQRGSWSPQVSLVSATTAPLASRVSIPPLASFAPQILNAPPLHSLSLDEQELAILEDLLYVFMGFEGQYVRFTKSYNPLEEKERLAGPEFRIMPGLDPSLHDLATSMLKMATHYIALEAFIEVQSRSEFGAVNHALCAAIRKLLKDYLVLMAQLEHQLLTNNDFTLHVLNLHIRPTSHILFQLYSIAQEILRKNSLLEDDLDDSSDDMNNVDNIIESLQEGGDANGLTTKKICKGGAVLGLITKRLATMAGDPAARSLLLTLLRESSRPYMAMLNEWLHQGDIKDPHGEFLIREQKSIRREGLEQDYTDQYWEKRYTVRESDVPPQLEGVKDKVLLAGKYLNVVRECGGVDISKDIKDIPDSFDDPRFLDNVNNAYAYANSSLLTLLLTTHALPARLRSLKHYFFLDRSDFFSYFLALATSELKKPAKNVNTGKLQSLLDIVLRQPGSVAAEDPYKEDVKIQVNEIGLTNWLMRVVTVTGLDQDAANGGMSNLLTPAVAPSIAGDDKDINGFEALVLDYAVPFPLSLVVSRVTLTRYQLLFRYLLSLRHLETLLIGSWTDHSKVHAWRHKSSNPKIELWKRKAWTLRARMLVFVQQLLYYCTSEVIEPNWQAFMGRLNQPGEASTSRPGSQRKDVLSDSSAPQTPSTRGSQPQRTVDELMQDHVDFLATCLKECMLTNSKLLRINSKVMTTCTMFANYTSSLSRYLAAADSDIATSTNTSGTGQATPAAHDPTKLDKLVHVLQSYEDNFSRHLKILLDALNYLAATETVVFLGLCARLSTASEGNASSEP